MPAPEVAHETREEIRVRRLSTEDMVREQLNRINAVRSDLRNPDRVAIWSECTEALADLLMPWAKDDKEWREKWDARPVAVITLPDGGCMAAPTAEDCRAAQQLLMELLEKNDMLVKKRNTSGPAPRDYAKAAPAAVPA